MLCVSDSNFTPAYSSDGALYRRFFCAHFRSPQLHQSWRIANDDDAFEVQAASPNPALLWEHTVQGDCWANAQPRSRLVSTRARYLLEQGLRTNAARGPSQLASAHGWDATKSCALRHPRSSSPIARTRRGIGVRMQQTRESARPCDRTRCRHRRTRKAYGLSTWLKQPHLTCT